MISAVLFITFFVLLILNIPIAICLGLSSVAAILYSGTSLNIVATNMYSGISKFFLQFHSSYYLVILWQRQVFQKDLLSL